MWKLTNQEWLWVCYIQWLCVVLCRNAWAYRKWEYRWSNFVCSICSIPSTKIIILFLSCKNCRSAHPLSRILFLLITFWGYNSCLTRTNQYCWRNPEWLFESACSDRERNKWRCAAGILWEGENYLTVDRIEYVWSNYWAFYTIITIEFAKYYCHYHQPEIYLSILLSK